jgi:hypothetical protein
MAEGQIPLCGGTEYDPDDAGCASGLTSPPMGFDTGYMDLVCVWWCVGCDTWHLG